MLERNQYLQPRDEEIAANVIDGEAIIINLANGVYYSMDKAGAVVWEMIQGKRSVEQAVMAVVDRYEVSPEQAEKDIGLLVAELLQENLIRVTENGVEDIAQVGAQAEQKQPYERPVLNIYRDMGDLLALDPPTPGLGDTPWKDPEDEPSR